MLSKLMRLPVISYLVKYHEGSRVRHKSASPWALQAERLSLTVISASDGKQLSPRQSTAAHFLSLNGHAGFAYMAETAPVYRSTSLGPVGPTAAATEDMSYYYRLVRPPLLMPCALQ